MRLDNSAWTFSPTDLSSFTRCAHVTRVRKGFRDGTLTVFAKPGDISLLADALARRGGDHEDAFLDSLKAEGKTIVTIDRKDPDAVERTRKAMQSGIDVVFQAALASEGWRGYADFLERVETPSALGSWSYEVLDTKLSTTPQPYFLLQLGIYSAMVASIQGSAPARMHLLLGDGTRRRYQCHDYSAHLRHIRRRFQDHFDSTAVSLPYPVEFCALCEWNQHCWIHLQRLDHLSIVAGIRRDHIKELQTAGIETLEQLANSCGHAIGNDVDIADPVLHRLQNQARLQLEARQSGKHRYEFLEPEERRGFQLLPQPSPGDLFFDVEADPFEGLTYLFGITSSENGVRVYRSLWAHDAPQERKSFEDVVDLIIERRRQFPEAHVYHYGPADVSTLKALMGRYGSREQEIDDLLRAGAFVDLLAVVRQSIRISHSGYSLKKVETFYFGRTTEGVIDAGGSIVAYENWLIDRDPQRLHEIEKYNKEDCHSTAELQRWLLALRTELESQRGISLDWSQPRPPEETKEEKEQEKLAIDALFLALTKDLPAEWSARDTNADPDARARWILAHLLHYHRREDKPVWWTFFERLTKSSEELVEDGECIGGLTPTGQTRVVKQSIATQFRFEPQQHKFKAGERVYDPHRLREDGWAESPGSIESIDDASGLIEIKRKGGFTPATLPRSIVPDGAISTTAIRAALRRFATEVVDRGWAASRYRAGSDLLRRELPRVDGHEPGAPLHGEHIDEATVQSLADRLTDSYLFIQGPPGTGKTYHGARIIVELMQRGKRIAVTATSHKAIENMLHEVERVAAARGFRFRGLKVSTSDANAYTSKLDVPCVIDTQDECGSGGKPDPTDHSFRLVAGTAWVFSKLEHEEQFDDLVIDEAGQMSLADALACSTAARNLLLLGDPLQLAQVSQGTHPPGCGNSVLEHLLGEDPTIPRDRGVFLEQTRRMHPDVCAFISEVVYDSRLESHESCSSRRIEAPLLTGTGLRFHPIVHEGNATRSVEEAEWIARTIETMLQGGRFIDAERERALTIDDFLVVTPYNAQVSAIRLAGNRRGLSLRAGTVDKFQGQEAPVVFFSMATSSDEDIPRSLDFLFSRNRLNVAISRAQCLAVVAASPRLLDVDCRTVEQMGLVNALCRFVEMSEA